MYQKDIDTTRVLSLLQPSIINLGGCGGPDTLDEGDMKTSQCTAASRPSSMPHGASCSCSLGTHQSHRGGSISLIGLVSLLHLFDVLLSPLQM
jgi:hypothetical protein